MTENAEHSTLFRLTLKLQQQEGEELNQTFTFKKVHESSVDTQNPNNCFYTCLHFSEHLLKFLTCAVAYKSSRTTTLAFMKLNLENFMKNCPFSFR